MSAALEGPCREIEYVRAKWDAAVRGGCAERRVLAVTTEHRVDAGDELARIERFAEIIVGAHLETDDAIDVFAFGCQHDDRDRFAGAAEATAHRQAVLAWQHQIQHDQMRRITLHFLVELIRIGERGHLKPLLGQVARQQVAQANVIVDDKNFGGNRFRDHDRGMRGRGARRLRQLDTSFARCAHVSARVPCNRL